MSHHIRAQHPMLLIMPLCILAFHIIHARRTLYSIRPLISRRCVLVWNLCGRKRFMCWAHHHNKLTHRSGSTAFSPYEFHEGKKRLKTRLKCKNIKCEFSSFVRKKDWLENIEASKADQVENVFEALLSRFHSGFLRAQQVNFLVFLMTSFAQTHEFL